MYFGTRFSSRRSVETRLMSPSSILHLNPLTIQSSNSCSNSTFTPRQHQQDNLLKANPCAEHDKIKLLPEALDNLRIQVTHKDGQWFALDSAQLIRCQLIEKQSGRSLKVKVEVVPNATVPQSVWDLVLKSSANLEQPPNQLSASNDQESYESPGRGTLLRARRNYQPLRQDDPSSGDPDVNENSCTVEKDVQQDHTSTKDAKIETINHRSLTYSCSNFCNDKTAQHRIVNPPRDQALCDTYLEPLRAVNDVNHNGSAEKPTLNDSLISNRATDADQVSTMQSTSLNHMDYCSCCKTTKEITCALYADKLASQKLHSSFKNIKIHIKTVTNAAGNALKNLQENANMIPSRDGKEILNSETAREKSELIKDLQDNNYSREFNGQYSAEKQTKRLDMIEMEDLTRTEDDRQARDINNMAVSLFAEKQIEYSTGKGHEYRNCLHNADTVRSYIQTKRENNCCACYYEHFVDQTRCEMNECFKNQIKQDMNMKQEYIKSTSTIEGGLVNGRPMCGNNVQHQKMLHNQYIPKKSQQCYDCEHLTDVNSLIINETELQNQSSEIKKTSETQLEANEPLAGLDYGMKNLNDESVAGKTYPNASFCDQCNCEICCSQDNSRTMVKLRSTMARRYSLHGDVDHEQKLMYMLNGWTADHSDTEDLDLTDSCSECGSFCSDQFHSESQDEEPGENDCVSLDDLDGCSFGEEDYETNGEYSSDDDIEDSCDDDEYDCSDDNDYDDNVIEEQHDDADMPRSEHGLYTLAPTDDHFVTTNI